MIRTTWILGASALILTACQQVPAPISKPVGEAEVIVTRTKAPKKDSNQCWGSDITPALVETVTERVMVSPAKTVTVPSTDGAPTYQTVQKPAVYKDQARQKIIKARQELWFEVPCGEALTTDFIASLQRALKSRGLYRGTLTGRMDAKTGKSVRWYQKAHGLNSSTLSLQAARQLGLISYLPAPK